MIIYPLIISAIIACTISESKCGTAEPVKKEYYSASTLEEKGIIPVYVGGYQYVPVTYLKAVEIDNVQGPVQPFWVTENYGVVPSHNYPYPHDATVYFSVEANKYGVLNEYNELETKEMEVLETD